MTIEAEVIVIGAGIAGASTAFFLREAGLEVIVLEKEEAPAMGASSNPICIVYPRFDAEWDKYTKFCLEHYKHALNFYQQWPESIIQCGVAIFSQPEKEEKLKTVAKMLSEKIACLHNATEFHDSYPGKYALFLPTSGYVKTLSLCTALLNNINVIYKKKISAITMMNGICKCMDIEGRIIASAKHLVLANSFEAAELLPDISTLIYPVHGQSSYTYEDIGYSGTHVLCFPNISLCPKVDGMHHFGSTYDRINMPLKPSVVGHKQNLDNLAVHFKEAAILQAENLQGSVGKRCFTKDYFPIAGTYHGLENLYLNIAHGSRAMVTAPLVAENLAKLISKS